MKNSNKITGKVTIGLDIGDRFSYLYSLSPEGDCLGESRLPTTPEDFSQYFEKIPTARVVIETGTHSPWVSRILSRCGHDVLVANSRQLRLIYKNPKKTDKEDAENLARTARVDPKLLHPIQHRPLEDQVDLETLRARAALVAARTQLINHVRGAVKSLGNRIPRCSAPAFHRQASEFVPQELQSALKPILETIEKLTAQIRGYDKSVDKELGDQKHPVTRILRQVPGVGPLTALAFVLVLGDPHRFKKSRLVGPYLGLTPRRDDSGQHSPQLRITKAGDGFLRQLLVGSAQYILGPFGPDSDLRRFGLALSRRGGKNAKKRAVVAVARKLAVLLHRLWICGECYEPFYQQRRKKQQEEFLPS
jgi:transposase